MMPPADKIKLTLENTKNGRQRWRKVKMIGGKPKTFTCLIREGETQAASKKRAWGEFLIWKADKESEATKENEQQNIEVRVNQTKLQQSESEVTRHQQINALQDVLLNIKKLKRDGFTDVEAVERAFDIASGEQIEYVREASADELADFPSEADEKNTYISDPLGQGIGSFDYSDEYDAEEIIQGGEDNIVRVIEELRGEEEKGLTSFILLDKYLVNRKRDCDNELITIDRYDKIRVCINAIKKYASDTTLINAGWLEDFYNKLMDSGYSSGHKKATFALCKQFIKWTWEREYIENMPRNIESFKIKVETKEPEIVPIEDMKQYYIHAADRARLYFLLALNCGFYSADISELRKDEIDLEKGIIKHKRVKTSEHKNVPVVSYKLFPETLKLLKKIMNNDEKKEIAILDRSGNKLLKKRLKPDGKMTKTDTIRLTFKRVFNLKSMKDLMKEDKAHDFLMNNVRHTSASIINEKFPQYASLFLAHSPKTVAERHYLKVSDDALNDALDYLYNKLDISSWKKKPIEKII